VPLTTVSLSNVPKHKAADATGLNSLFRQMGGAVGIAIFASFIDNYAKLARGGIDAQMTLTRPEVWSRMQMLEGAFRARGLDAGAAHDAAMRAMTGTVMQQSVVLGFERIFIVAGALFLLVIPMLIFLKAPARPAGPKPDVHVEM